MSSECNPAFVAKNLINAKIARLLSSYDKYSRCDLVIIQFNLKAKELQSTSGVDI